MIGEDRVGGGGRAGWMVRGCEGMVRERRGCKGRGAERRRCKGRGGV